ncbi:MAG: radical SAM protein [Desulfuromonas sp.]|nr:MAG: radical SAM protein [Desulfuromonas sp.]
MLLIYPPVAKPTEPPPGIALLAGALQGQNCPVEIIDANIEGLEYLINKPALQDDTWTKRAKKNACAHLNSLRDNRTYLNPARYQRCIADLNRALNQTTERATISVSNYVDGEFSSVSSHDLLAAAAAPEKNPFYDYFSPRLQQALSSSRHEHIGFSLNYLSQAVVTFAMIGHVRRIAPQITIVLGGGLITSWMRHPNWSNPFAALVDRCIDGPGERALLNHCGIAVNHSTALADYSQLPLERYWSPSLILPYAASRGCYWNRCSFCPERAEQNRYTSAGANQNLDELHQLCQRWQPGLVHLLDNAISPALLDGLIQRPLGVNWYGFARVNERLTDLDYCRALKKAGCVLLKLGIESGDDQVLAQMEKGVTSALTEKVLTTLKQAGLATYVYLLFGTPGETPQAAEHTLTFIRRNHAAVTFLNLAIFNLPTNSSDAQQLALRPFYQGDLSLYSDFEHPYGWNRGDVRRFLEKTFKKDPAIAAILRRDPPQMTSNHAPFFVEGC